MTHLGQRLSALIDGELEGSERERVLVHMTRCGSCRDEVAALRMLKRRMNALGEAAAGAGLTGRLMSLSELMGLDEPRLGRGHVHRRDDLAAACASRGLAWRGHPGRAPRQPIMEPPGSAGGPLLPRRFGGGLSGRAGHGGVHRRRRAAGAGTGAARDPVD